MTPESRGRPERVLLRARDVLKLVPISRPTLYRLMSKGDFPKAIRIGSSSCWVEAEIEAWINHRLDER